MSNEQCAVVVGVDGAVVGAVVDAAVGAVDGAVVAIA